MEDFFFIKDFLYRKIVAFLYFVGINLRDSDVRYRFGSVFFYQRVEEHNYVVRQFSRNVETFRAVD